MKANFNPILPYFSLHIPLRSLCCIFNCSDMLLWSTVIQITQIQLSTNTHFWVINWKPHIEIFPERPSCIMQYGWQRWKATTAALLSPIFWLQGHIPNQKSLWELFTQDGTDQPHWLMDYQATRHYVNHSLLHYRRIYARLGLNYLKDWRIENNIAIKTIFRMYEFHHVDAIVIVFYMQETMIWTFITTSTAFIVTPQLMEFERRHLQHNFMDRYV